MYDSPPPLPSVKKGKTDPETHTADTVVVAENKETRNTNTFLQSFVFLWEKNPLPGYLLRSKTLIASSFGSKCDSLSPPEKQELIDKFSSAEVIRTHYSLKFFEATNSCFDHMKQINVIFSTNQTSSVKGGFATEYHHAHTFTQDAIEKGLSVKAELAPNCHPETDIFIKNGKEIIEKIQCKISDHSNYINKAAKNPKYEGNLIIKNSDNKGGRGLSNVSDLIDIGGAKSTPITKGEACNKNYQAKCCKKTNIWSNDTVTTIAMMTSIQSAVSALKNGVSVVKGQQSLEKAGVSILKDTGKNIAKNVVIVTASKIAAKNIGCELVPFIGPAVETIVNVSLDLKQTGGISKGTGINVLISTSLTSFCVICPFLGPPLLVSLQIGSLFF
eukprot:Tbor_TRINITY_DN5981_c3_g2::TRINITY_DN5981_c3_g2_i2::g.19180::m.19180